MRIGTSKLDMRKARSLQDALSILDTEPRMPVAGATDVYVGLNFGTLRETQYLDIWACHGLRGISLNANGTLSIGALTTYTEMIRSEHVSGLTPLAFASEQVGGPQIQNRGTIGGNVANASPAGDTLPILAVMEAVVVLRSAHEERRVRFNEFYTGYRATVRKPNELIVAIEIPLGKTRYFYRKVGTRAAQAISKVVIAGARAPEPRIALGSVAATVVRLPRTEAALAAGRSIDEAVEVLQTEITPIDDVRSTAEYRLKVASNLVREFWRRTS